MNPSVPNSGALIRDQRVHPAGYALILMMIAVTVLLISLTAALPSIYQESQREREEEAVFRGGQYARAIYLFHRRMGRFPVSVKDLLRTDNVRFLRKVYRDPLSPNGRWRFIHAAAGGILIDSWNQTTLSPHASQLDQTFNEGNQGMNSSNASTASGSAETSEANAVGTSKGKPKHPPSTCTGPEDQSQGSSTQTGTLLGAFIVGVAPCNDKQSIRVLNHRDHYDHWEFLGLKYPVYRLPEANAPNASHPFQPTPASQMGNPSPSGQQEQQMFNGPQGTSSSSPGPDANNP